MGIFSSDCHEWYDSLNSYNRDKHFGGQCAPLTKKDLIGIIERLDILIQFLQPESNKLQQERGFLRGPK